MNMALARYLKDFSAPAQDLDIPLSGNGDFGQDGAGMDLGFPAPLSPQEERDVAHQEGYELARQELEEQHRDQLATAEIAHQEELAELRRHYEMDIAAQVAATMAEFTRSLSETVSATVADMLGPFLSDLVVEKSVESLAELISQAVAEGEVGQITVKGPQRLYDALLEHVGGDAGLLRHVESDDLDLTAEVDGSVFVTRVSAWTASLKKVLE